MVWMINSLERVLDRLFIRPVRQLPSERTFLKNISNAPGVNQNNGFFNGTSDGINGLALCRGDVLVENCPDCVNFASQEIARMCPSSGTAFIWFDECMLRYSGSNFFGKVETTPALLKTNVMNSDDPNSVALSLMDKLVAEAKTNDKLFGANFNPLDDGTGSRYGMVQCTRDLNSTSCANCLEDLINVAKTCCISKVGWGLYSPSCTIRYENYSFLRPQPEPSPQPLPPPPVPQPVVLYDETAGKNTTMIVIITISSIAVVVALCGLWFYSFHGRRKSREQEIPLQEFEGSPSMDISMHVGDHDKSGEMQYFNLNTIQTATNNFSDSNKLGEGGFGPVYKGKLIDGKEIAVKRLSIRSRQGIEEFKNEVMFIVKLQHKNLVRLLGCCLEGAEKLLVYEYMANTSLDAFLFDPTKRRDLDWAKRANIVNGIARGVLYLHEDSRLKIIHRDLKASNVLLDDEMNPKISDFGTARNFGSNQIEANTNRIVGTYGYMAPEYAMEGQFSIKSDVYSFGVLLLEIISGKKNSGLYHPIPERAQSLLPQAWRLWNEGKRVELIDQTLVDDCPVSEALRLIHIALLCVQEDPNDRPTMSLVVLMLASRSIYLPQPSAPPFSIARFTFSDQSTTTGAEAGISGSDQSSTIGAEAGMVVSTV
ncbi:hypothetical protein I3843_01G285900 [Carya illinoinensis]|nr:hypothetical protein I3843_01G285900 [Carya illinoinensis]